MTFRTLVLVLSSVELQRGDVAGRAIDGHNEVIRAGSVDNIGRTRGGDSDATNNASPSEDEAEKC